MSIDHEQRRKTLGASEIAAACGLNPWTSRKQLWELKTGRAKPFRGNASTDIGNWLEEPVAQWYASQHPEILSIVKPETRYAKNRPWSSNPDRLVTAEGGKVWLLEVKTGTDDEGWGKTLSQEIPEYYYIQGQWQLYLEYLEGRNLDRVDFAVFLKGDVPDYERRREYSFAKDNAKIDFLISAAEDFWGYVERDEPPPEDVKDDQPYCAVTPEITETIRIKDAAKQREKLAIAEQSEATKKLKKIVPQGSKCITESGSAVWSERKGTTKTDFEAAFWATNKDNPIAQSVLDSFTNTSEPTWVLTVKGKK